MSDKYSYAITADATTKSSLGITQYLVLQCSDAKLGAIAGYVEWKEYIGDSLIGIRYRVDKGTVHKDRTVGVGSASSGTYFDPIYVDGYCQLHAKSVRLQA